ncbi:MAG: tRNA (adenosine(37)-N6)-dimethylallyltransferase MiaA [Pseudohongiella sp.]|nr:tRNA (adenosine(37)-N6)-dimethylallyltransferase MiaA [Pseudohongiella sp.]
MELDPQSCPVICLMGPTASGKTALAIELVQRFPMEIISVDSAQIYRGMDIGTGKPDAATLEIAPHRLIDFLDPAESYSAARFCVDARREMAEIRARGNIPLLTGGTMLYFKALRDGLAQMPAADEKVRAEILTMANSGGWAAVHAELMQVDPVSGARIHPNDPQRLQRALEVYRVSGRSLTDWQREAQQKSGDDAVEPLLFLSIQPTERSVLHNRIEARFRKMLDDGLVDEVSLLRARRDLHEGLPSIRSVGYRQVWQYLGAEYGYDAMVERGIIATRQLAKRQITWLRSWSSLHNFDSEDKNLIDTVINTIGT